MALIHVLFLFLVSQYCLGEVEQSPQTTIHVVTMTHLDVGYNGIPETGFIYNVLNRYFDEYIPNTIAIINELKQAAGPKLIYTTHPWLVSMYIDCPPGMGLHCPSPAALRNFNDSVHRGDITWHAFPFNVQAEVMDKSLFTYGIQLGKDLDNLFGMPHKTVMSQRDVPGTTRAIIPLLAANGIQAVTIGVNGGSAPPAVDKIFVWRDPDSGQDIIGMVNPGSYGDINIGENVHLPGSPHVLAFNFVGDNGGPPSVQDVKNNWNYLSKVYPGALIKASTYDAFITEALKVKQNLPIVEAEMGDTWVYGVPSDPVKMSVFREISRLRTECVESGECSLDDPRVKNMSRFLIKLPEHTWGLPGTNDQVHWNNSDFNTLKNDPTKLFLNCSLAWLEQRTFNDHAITALGNHTLADRIRDRLATIGPVLPDLTQYKYVPFNQFTCGQFVIGFSTKGGINFLRSSVTGHMWASDNNPLAQYVYTTFTEENVTGAFNQYCYNWNSGFVKPGVDHYGRPVYGDWLLVVDNFYQKLDGSCDFLLNMHSSDPGLVKNYGAAQSYWTHVIIEQNKIYVNFTWFGKSPTRLPESHYFTFDPITELDTGGYWLMDKMGSLVNPQDVMFNGSQHQHGVWDGVQYIGTDGVVLKISSLDAGIVSPFQRTPFPAPDMTPRQSIKGGMSYHLFNNIWDTNYILWYPYSPIPSDSNTLFRFILEEVPGTVVV